MCSDFPGESVHGGSAEERKVLSRVPARQPFLRPVRRVRDSPHSSVSGVAGLERRRGDLCPINGDDVGKDTWWWREMAGQDDVWFQAAAAAAESGQQATD